MVTTPEGIELHNVGEARPQPDGGVLFQRVPETVRLRLNPHAQERMRDVVGTEIRFVLRGPRAVVRLHNLGGATEAQLFLGDFRTGQTWPVGPEPCELVIEPPPWFAGIDPESLRPWGFSPRVCRLMLSRGSICFHGVDGDVRPPEPQELPSVRYLAYGTSITQGSSASMRHLSYVHQTAWRLRADAINLGSASSAFCEPALADYIAERTDWTLATLALSTNMNGFTLDAFRERVGYMVRRVGSTDPRRVVACITLWPKAADLTPGLVPGGNGGTPEAYRQVLREEVAACGLANVHLIEGPDLLPGFRGLSPDLLHPSDFGHAEIADRLSRRLAPWLPPGGTVSALPGRPAAAAERERPLCDCAQPGGETR